MGQFQDVDEKPDKDMVPGAGVNGAAGRVVIDSELMADIGHQLRNQLNAVLGAAGLLSGGAESGEERELASIVEVGAEQVARLIDDVLDAAIMQSGELELALHPFDLRSCVEMCIALVADDAGVKSLDLSFGAQPDVPSIVVGDSRRLEQILLTLLHGAIDRTFRGGVGIELSSEDRGGLVALHFTIRDTGRGVPARILRGGLDGTPAQHEHMEPGDRLAVLSLGTTKQLVEMMDGDLRVEQGGVEAGPDAGTAFDFTILAQALPASVATGQLTLDGMRVLVVSADATDKRVLALQAEQWGAGATAVSPEEALGIVKEGRPFDIALVEHRPPAIDGLALSTQIRALRRPDQLPIVLISVASPGPQEAEAADNGVIQATLTKPVVPRTLHDVMVQVGAHGEVPPQVAKDAMPGGLSVLIADDNALNQNLLRRLVTKLGHSADVVSNGREAVAAIAQQPYDAVLMDVLMPEMDGLAAAEAICRRWPRGNRPRLIALTALAGPGDQERCIKAGFDDYMSKPVHLADLVEALRAAAGYRTSRERTAL
ncbi:MAG TPA: response regulator [Candidatus Dormibacteraeota bacterium]|nr:response regulator [Candidatus Dormibacteraeota bacterium]